MMNKKFADKQKEQGNWTPQVAVDDIANDVMKDGDKVVAFAGIYVTKDGGFCDVKSKTKGCSAFQMIGVLDQLRFDLMGMNNN